MHTSAGITFRHGEDQHHGRVIQRFARRDVGYADKGMVMRVVEPYAVSLADIQFQGLPVQRAGRGASAVAAVFAPCGPEQPAESDFIRSFRAEVPDGSAFRQSLHQRHAADSVRFGQADRFARGKRRAGKEKRKKKGGKDTHGGSLLTPGSRRKHRLPGVPGAVLRLLRRLFPYLRSYPFPCRRSAGRFPLRCRRGSHPSRTWR